MILPVVMAEPPNVMAGSPNVMAGSPNVMAGLDPAITLNIVLMQMAGSGPAATTIKGHNLCLLT
jgi:hypothetical protein